MPSEKRLIGNLGEDEAVRHLKKLGYKIVERNFFWRFGEIDIIAWDKDVLVFIEVKLRKTDAFGSPAEQVTTYKQERIKKTALMYLQKHKIEPYCRFDIVEITGMVIKNKLKVEKIGVMKDAF